MATTVQNVIDRAALRSNLNDTTLVSSTPMIAFIDSWQKRVYLTAARVNPDYFGAEGNSTTRTSGATWSLASSPSSSGIAAVTRVEVKTVVGTTPLTPVGTEVNMISIRNPNAALAPRAYLRSRTITEYSSELSVDASNYVSVLKLWYSPLPTTLTATSDNLTLPDEFSDLLTTPLARMLSIRDQRAEETTVLDQEFAISWSTFLSAMSVYDEVVVRELARV